MARHDSHSSLEEPHRLPGKIPHSNSFEVNDDRQLLWLLWLKLLTILNHNTLSMNRLSQIWTFLSRMWKLGPTSGKNPKIILKRNPQNSYKNEAGKGRGYFHSSPEDYDTSQLPHLPKILHAINVVIDKILLRDTSLLELIDVKHAGAFIVREATVLVREVEAVRIHTLDQRKPIQTAGKRKPTMKMNSLVLLLYSFLIHLLWKYLFHSINFAVDFIEMVPESNILYKNPIILS